MSELKFRDLRADEIDCRVQQISKKRDWVSILLYKDARCDMNILDETLGCFNWQRDHKELKGNIYCGVSIWDEQKSQWVTKWDCGKESNTEAEKGEASDSFKRACFNLGIGRELYTSPQIFIKDGFELDETGQKCKTRFSVKTISIDNKKIISLEIVNNRNEVVFTYGMTSNKAQNQNENKKVDKIPTKSTNVENTSPNQATQGLDEWQRKAALLDEDEMQKQLGIAISTSIDGRHLGEWYKNKERQFVLDYYNSEYCDPSEKWVIAVVEESIRRKKAQK